MSRVVAVLTVLLAWPPHASANTLKARLAMHLPRTSQVLASSSHHTELRAALRRGGLRPGRLLALLQRLDHHSLNPDSQNGSQRIASRMRKDLVKIMRRAGIKKGMANTLRVWAPLSSRSGLLSLAKKLGALARDPSASEARLDKLFDALARRMEQKPVLAAVMKKRADKKPITRKEQKATAAEFSAVLKQFMDEDLGLDGTEQAVVQEMARPLKDMLSPRHPWQKLKSKAREVSTYLPILRLVVNQLRLNYLLDAPASGGAAKRREGSDPNRKLWQKLKSRTRTFLLGASGDAAERRVADELIMDAGEVAETALYVSRLPKVFNELNKSESGKALLSALMQDLHANPKLAPAVDAFKAGWVGE